MPTACPRCHSKIREQQAEIVGQQVVIKRQQNKIEEMRHELALAKVAIGAIWAVMETPTVLAMKPDCLCETVEEEKEVRNEPSGATDEIERLQTIVDMLPQRDGMPVLQDFDPEDGTAERLRVFFRYSVPPTGEKGTNETLT